MWCPWNLGAFHMKLVRGIIELRGGDLDGEEATGEEATALFCDNAV